VDGCDLCLERRVDEPVAGEQRPGGELRGHDDGSESLAASTCVGCVSGSGSLGPVARVERRGVMKEGGLVLAELTRNVFNLDMRGVEFGLQCRGDGLGCYARGGCFGGCLGVGHGAVRAGGGVDAGSWGDDSGCPWYANVGAEEWSS
jgi:hypothetical protein